MHRLEFGEQCDERRAVPAAFAFARDEWCRRHDERRIAQHARDLARPRTFERCGIEADAARDPRAIDVVRHEEFGRVWPERVDRGLHPRVARRRTVAEPHHPLGAPFRVVRNFFDGFCGDRRDLSVTRCGEFV